MLFNILIIIFINFFKYRVTDYFVWHIEITNTSFIPVLINNRPYIIYMSLSKTDYGDVIFEIVLNNYKIIADKFRLTFIFLIDRVYFLIINNKNYKWKYKLNRTLIDYWQLHQLSKFAFDVLIRPHHKAFNIIIFHWTFQYMRFSAELIKRR